MAAPSSTTSSAGAPHPPELSKLLTKLRPFQREAFDFATKGQQRQRESGGQNARSGKNNDGYAAAAGTGGRILLADEMGLGKTVTSLAIMTAYMSEWPLLILCPASLRHTWPSEIEKFLPSLPASCVYVVSGFDDADFYQNPIKRARIKIVIATYSLLQDRSAAARVLDQFDFRCIIADESHNLKERTSQRCKLAMPLLKKARRLCLLSGTPALARPVELWAQLHCLDPNLFGTYTAFTKQYCNAHRGRFGWDVKGVSNGDELHAKLQSIMVRRLKSNVLKELPPKQRTIVPIKIGQDHISKCRDIMEDMAATRLSVAELAGEDAEGANFEARKLLMQAYQATGIGKAPEVANYLTDWLNGSGTQKILVFAHHREVLDVLEAAISRKMKGVGHIRIDGVVPPSERAVRVRKFQNDARVRVALLSVTAAGVGLTLTSASSVIFAELHWTPGVLAQAEDRVHRIGQHNAVNIMYCVSKETELSVDVSLLKMLGKKISNLGKVIDGDNSASLNAREIKEDENGLTRAGGISAEDELTSFFAETSPSSTAVTLPQPVKGSIESFFTKKTDQAKGNEKGRTRPPVRSIDTKLNRITPSEKRWGEFCFNENTSTASSSSCIGNISKSSLIRSMVTWSCHACTFVNTMIESPSATFSCEVCQTQMLETDSQEATAPNATQSNSKGSARSDACISSDNASAHSVTPVTSSSKDVIEICDDSSSAPNATQSNSKGSARSDACFPFDNAPAHAVTTVTSSSKDVIEICDDSSEEEDDKSNAKVAHRRAVLKSDHGDQLKKKARHPPRTAHVDTCKMEEKTDLLSFSVSENSGRIAIHFAKTNEPLHVNFAIEQAVADSSTDHGLKTKTKRMVSRQEQPYLSTASVRFDEQAVMQVVKLIDEDLAFKANLSDDTEKACTELKTFVSTFLSLREIEKKTIKKWGHPETPSLLRQTAAGLLSTTAAAASTERYSSAGAKECAIENEKNNCATELDQAVIRGDACAWCGAHLSGASKARGVESTYCSTECAEEGRLRRGGMYASTRVRAQVFALEGGVCRLCGIDAHALFLRISALEPAERLNALLQCNWKLPQTGPALERLLQKPKEGDFWQADHIRAVSEGGGGCGLDNLQTLCTPCHKTETEKLRARLRLSGGPAASYSCSSSRSNIHSAQMDIRAAFVTKSDCPRKRRKKSAD